MVSVAKEKRGYLPMRLRVCLVGLGMLVMVSAAQAQSSKIAFVTDRDAPGDLDVWAMDDDGDNPAGVTSEVGDVRNPSITPNGTKIIYERGNDLYLGNADGSGTPSNLTANLSEPYGDPDVGPLVFGGQGDFRIVFTRTAGSPAVSNIWMARFDVSEGHLTNFVQLTDADATDGGQFDPSWCGSTHIVWARPSPVAAFYEPEICILQVGPTGAVGDPACYFGDDGATDLDDTEPSCRPDGSQIAWVRGGAYGGTTDIWVMDCDGTDCDWENADNLMEDSHALNDFHPVWSPSGSVIAFVSDRAKGPVQEDDDLDIWIMSDIGEEKTNITDDYSDEDNDPDWGPAAL